MLFPNDFPFFFAAVPKSFSAAWLASHSLFLQCTVFTHKIKPMGKCLRVMLQRILMLELAQWIRKHCTQTVCLMLFIWEGKGKRQKTPKLYTPGEKMQLVIKNQLKIDRYGKKITVTVSRSVVSNLLWPYGLYSPPGSSIRGIFPGKNTGVGSHSLLQGIFPTQGSNPSLLHCKQILYHLSLPWTEETGWK